LVQSLLRQWHLSVLWDRLDLWVQLNLLRQLRLCFRLRRWDLLDQSDRWLL
jgi:hypothetical protein